MLRLLQAGSCRRMKLSLDEKCRSSESEPHKTDECELLEGFIGPFPARALVGLFVNARGRIFNIHIPRAADARGRLARRN